MCWFESFSCIWAGLAENILRGNGNRISIRQRKLKNKNRNRGRKMKNRETAEPGWSQRTGCAVELWFAGGTEQSLCLILGHLLGDSPYDVTTAVQNPAGPTRTPLDGCLPFLFYTFPSLSIYCSFPFLFLLPYSFIHCSSHHHQWVSILISPTWSVMLWICKILVCNPLLKLVFPA